MLSHTCNNIHCTLHPATLELNNIPSDSDYFNVTSEGLCMYCNAIKHHEGYGHIKIEYNNVCGCGVPIIVDFEMCWDCNHDINGCDMCHPNH